MLELIAYFVSIYPPLKFGTLRQIRTVTEWFLRPVPLPIGLRGQIWLVFIEVNTPRVGGRLGSRTLGPCRLLLFSKPC